MAKTNTLRKTTPYVVDKNIKTLGSNLKTARLRRGLTIKEIASKLGVDSRAISAAERGTPTTPIVTYVALLWIYNLNDQITELANPLKDTVGLQMANMKAPKRIKQTRELDNDF